MSEQAPGLSRDYEFTDVRLSAGGDLQYHLFGSGPGLMTRAALRSTRILWVGKSGMVLMNKKRAALRETPWDQVRSLSLGLKPQGGGTLRVDIGHHGEQFSVAMALPASDAGQAAALKAELDRLPPGVFAPRCLECGGPLLESVCQDCGIGRAQGAAFAGLGSLGTAALLALIITVVCFVFGYEYFRENILYARLVSIGVLGAVLFFFRGLYRLGKSLALRQADGH